MDIWIVVSKSPPQVFRAPKTESKFTVLYQAAQLEATARVPKCLRRDHHGLRRLDMVLDASGTSGCRGVTSFSAGLGFVIEALHHAPVESPRLGDHLCVRSRSPLLKHLPRGVELGVDEGGDGGA